MCIFLFMYILCIIEGEGKKINYLLLEIYLFFS